MTSPSATRSRTFELRDLIRPNIRSLKPYRSARDSYEEGVLLDANENSYGSPYAEAAELNLHRYPSPAQKELRNRIADFRGVEVNNVFTGVGSDEAIDLLMRIFCEPGTDRIIITPPTYGMYEVAANTNNVDVQKIELTSDFHLRPEAILKVADFNSKLLFLCSPNNPTGNHLRHIDLIRLMEKFPGIVVVDEAYIDFSDRKSLAPMVRRYPNLVVLQTLSKAFGLAGIRLGMAFGDPELISFMHRVKAPYNVNALTSRYAVKAFDHLDKIREHVEAIREERNRMVQALQLIDEVEHIAPSDANFVLFKIARAREVYSSLAREGVIVRFRGDEPHCENGLRLTIGTPDENDLFLSALKTILSSHEYLD